VAYNLTDAELAHLSTEQLLELSDANIEMSRRLDAEMTRRGIVTEVLPDTPATREVDAFLDDPWTGERRDRPDRRLQ
jgi:hypothetical protein